MKLDKIHEIIGRLLKQKNKAQSLVEELDLAIDLLCKEANADG